MARTEQIKYFRKVMLSTEREGMEDLLGFMQELGFYDAPASGGNHCCKDGGLLEHTVNVAVINRSGHYWKNVLAIAFTAGTSLGKRSF